MGREEFRNAQARHARAEQSDLAKRLERSMGGVPINANVIDRFGRPLKIGCEVLFHNPVDMVFTIVDIAPEIDPNAQAGIFRLELKCKPLRLHTRVGLPTDLLVVTMYAEVAAQAPAGEPPLAAPEASPYDALPDLDSGKPQAEEDEDARLDSAAPPAMSPSDRCIIAGYCSVHGLALPHNRDGSLAPDIEKDEEPPA